MAVAVSFVQVLFIRTPKNLRPSQFLGTEHHFVVAARRIWNKFSCKISKVENFKPSFLSPTASARIAFCLCRAKKLMCFFLWFGWNGKKTLLELPPFIVWVSWRHALFLSVSDFAKMLSIRTTRPRSVSTLRWSASRCWVFLSASSCESDSHVIRNQVNALSLTYCCSHCPLQVGHCGPREVQVHCFHILQRSPGWEMNK